MVKGRLTIKMRDRSVDLHEKEFVIVPRGVEHRPRAGDEVYFMLPETKTTLNTGFFEVRRQR